MTSLYIVYIYKLYAMTSLYMVYIYKLYAMTSLYIYIQTVYYGLCLIIKYILSLILSYFKVHAFKCLIACHSYFNVGS